MAYYLAKFANSSCDIPQKVIYLVFCKIKFLKQITWILWILQNLIQEKTQRIEVEQYVHQSLKFYFTYLDLDLVFNNRCETDVRIFKV